MGTKVFAGHLKRVVVNGAVGSEYVVHEEVAVLAGDVGHPAARFGHDEVAGV